MYNPVTSDIPIEVIIGESKNSVVDAEFLSVMSDDKPNFHSHANYSLKKMAKYLYML